MTGLPLSMDALLDCQAASADWKGLEITCMPLSRAAAMGIS